MATLILPDYAQLPPTPPGPGPYTLAELEQETAARVGPFALFSVTTGDQAGFTVAELQSSADLGGWLDLYILRRTAASPEDRVSRVKEYDPATGRLTGDRHYARTFSPGEPVELHHLPPSLLRRGVRAGLRRCFVQWWVELPAPTPDDPTPPPYVVPASGPVDLTAVSGGWLTNPAAVLDVCEPIGEGANRPNGNADAVSIEGWRVYGQGGRVLLMLAGGRLNYGATVLASRPAYTLVNGAVALAGPTNDTDLLEVSLDYAAAFGHIELWRVARPELEAVAAEARQASQAEAAAEASRMAVTWAPWLFVTGGARKDRIAPLAGLRGAYSGAVAPSLAGAVVNSADPPGGGGA